MHPAPRRPSAHKYPSGMFQVCSPQSAQPPTAKSFPSTSPLTVTLMLTTSVPHDTTQRSRRKGEPTPKAWIAMPPRTPAHTALPKGDDRHGLYAPHDHTYMSSLKPVSFLINPKTLLLLSSPARAPAIPWLRLRSSIRHQCSRLPLRSFTNSPLRFSPALPPSLLDHHASPQLHMPSALLRPTVRIRP